MCGRFTLTVDPADLQLMLELGAVPAELQPRYNIAPTQPVAVVTDQQERRVEFLGWGLIPAWAKDPAIGSQMINARAETVPEKPAFKAAFNKRRCLILADGFYEWQKIEQGSRTFKRPHYIQLAGGTPFAFAGLWETWKSPQGDTKRTCTIITCEPNEVMTPIHNRMPVILDKELMWDWLQPDATPLALRALLVPYAGPMALHPVSTLVNKPENDTPQCVMPEELTP